MFGKRRLLEEIADLKEQLAAAQEREKKALAQAEAERYGKQVALRRAERADERATRIEARNRRLTERLILDPIEDAAHQYEQMENRLVRLIRACARYRTELAALRRLPAAPAPARPGEWTPEGGQLRPLSPAMQLLLAEQARRSLDDRVRELQRINEEQGRELVDRAGTLARRGGPCREPGVAPYRQAEGR